MILQWVKHILILPGTMLVYIPGAILWVVADRPGALAPAGPGQVRFWIGIALAMTGLVLSTWCARLFVTLGRGTPAPWDPPAKLVVHGPYRHVRNPMITSVLFLLGAESLLLGSWHLAGWMAVFFLLKTLYFLRFEEPGLERRFGAGYRRYKVNVPRWIPRLRPWDPGGQRIDGSPARCLRVDTGSSPPKAEVVASFTQVHIVQDLTDTYTVL